MAEAARQIKGESTRVKNGRAFQRTRSWRGYGAEKSRVDDDDDDDGGGGGR
jgi:hypothetical protein